MISTNVRLSRSVTSNLMIKRIFSCLLLLGAGGTQKVCSQTIIQRDSVMHRDFKFVQLSDLWLTENNAAALIRFHSDNISSGEMYAQYAKGGFINYSQSPRLLNIGAEAESFYRLSPHAVVYGLINYNNFSGHDMTGSVFIDPTDKPIDIVEDSVTNRGEKHLDTYHLIGAIGFRLWKDISLGAKIDFTAANYAKYKDLRHQNKLTDIKGSLGIYYPVNDKLQIGSYYSYRRDIESLRYNVYGKTDRTYISLIDYGGFIGQTEQFSTEGYTGSDQELPFFDEYQGYGVQIDIKMHSLLTWHNSFSTDRRHGYYGRNSPYTIVYTRHQGHEYEYSSILEYRLPKSLHQLNISLSADNTTNTIQHYLSAVNKEGATYYEYYDPVKSGNKVTVNTNIGYTGYWDIKGEIPTWNIGMGVNLYHRNFTAYCYPFYRKQRWNSTEAYFTGTHNINLSKGILTLCAGASYKKGSGKPYEDGTFIAPSDKQQSPPEEPVYLYQEYAWYMAPQYRVKSYIKYAFIFPDTLSKAYIQLQADNRHANVNNNYLRGHDHWSITCTIGCNF